MERWMGDTDGKEAVDLTSWKSHHISTWKASSTVSVGHPPICDARTVGVEIMVADIQGSK